MSFIKRSVRLVLTLILANTCLLVGQVLADDLSQRLANGLGQGDGPYGPIEGPLPQGDGNGNVRRPDAAAAAAAAAAARAQREAEEMARKVREAAAFPLPTVPNLDALIGRRGGGSSAGSASTTGPIRVELGTQAEVQVGGLKRQIQQIDSELFRQLQAREAARWNYTYTNGLPAELERFKAAQKQIEQLQHDRFQKFVQLNDAIVADKPERKAKLDEHMQKVRANAKATYGLNNNKFVNFDWQGTPYEYDPANINRWLNNADYDYRPGQ